MDIANFWLPIIGGILLGGFAVTALFSGYKILGLWTGFAGVICFLLLATLQVQQIISASSEVPVVPETEFHGFLLPANDPTPPNGCTSRGPLPEGAILTLMGNNGVFFVGMGKVVVLQLARVETITMERTSEGLQIGADIRDASGLLVARIEQNEFHAIQAQISYSKRPDRSTLIVYDKYGEQIFWVRFLNQTTVQFLGKFYLPNGSPVTIEKDAMHIGTNTVSMGCAGVMKEGGRGWVIL